MNGTQTDITAQGYNNLYEKGDVARLPIRQLSIKVQIKRMQEHI